MSSGAGLGWMSGGRKTVIYRCLGYPRFVGTTTGEGLDAGGVGFGGILEDGRVWPVERPVA